MPKFTIPVSWTMITDMEIEADSLDEAITKAESQELPEDGEYLDSSFDINYECAFELNKPEPKVVLIEPNKETT